MAAGCHTRANSQPPYRPLYYGTCSCAWNTKPPEELNHGYRLQVLNANMGDEHNSNGQTTENQTDKPFHWGYLKHNGPLVWPEHFPICKNGKRQSPIDILRKDVRRGSAGPFYFGDKWHDHGNGWKVTNNSHTVCVEVPHGFEFSGGDLPAGDHYMTAQFHFHWGAVDDRGAEHLVDGFAYPIEMHVVTYDVKYPSFEVASRQEDGLAVLGLFFKVSSETNQALEPLIKVMDHIKEPGSSTTVDDMHLMSLIDPVVHTKYWRYSGSLTTPGCDESKVWSVFEEPLSISEDQLEKFRSMLAEPGIPLVDNFRPPQPLNDRVVIEH